ncbi:MAG: sulfite exporter TauE/SafE family protein [Vicinamibacterales bacterium]
MTAAAWLVASLIGLSLGLLGGGGSILTVPVFTFLLGYEPKQAIAMSLPIVGAAAAAGAMSALARGTLPLGPAVVMGPATMAGSYAGAWLASFLDGRTQLLFLAVIMLSAAAAMWHRSGGGGEMHRAAHPHPVLVIAIGLAVGVLTGLVGIGGGFLIVPALVLVGGLPMRQATSASLLVIALSAAAGLAGYLGRVTFDWPVVGVFASVAAAGAVVGGYLGGRIPARRLQQGFAALLVTIAGYILFSS